MGDIFRISTRVSVSDAISEFTLNYDQTAGAEDAESARSAAVAFRDNVLGPLQAILATEARVECFFVRKITGSTIPAWVGNEFDANGTIPSNSATAQNCLLINLRNAAGLLKRSGRIFVSGCPSGELANGVWKTSFITPFVDNFMAAIKTIPAGGTGNWEGSLIVWKTVTDGVKLDPPVAIAVDSLDATLELGTQHSRKGKLTGLVSPTPP